MIEKKEKLNKIALFIDEKRQLVINKVSKFIKEPTEDNLNLISLDIKLLDEQLIEFKKCIMEIIQIKIANAETPEVDEDVTEDATVDVVSVDGGLKII